MTRTLDQLADAYHNPLQSQQRVFDELLNAIQSADGDGAAEAAALLAKQIEQHGIEEIETPGDDLDDDDRYSGRDE